MNCADLGSLLEAHLERRLGRGEIDALRRHLLACRRCRQRIHELRRFELEVAARVPQFADAAFWSVLEVEPAALLMRPTAGGLPAPGAVRVPAAPVRPRPPAAADRPRPPALRPARLLTRLFGIALLALAGLGLVAQFDRGLLRSGGEEVAPGADREGLDLETPDPARLEAWLAAELGDAPPFPPVPAGWTLLGGRIDGAGEAATPVVVFRREPDVRIAVRILRDRAPERDGVPDGLVIERDGYAYLIEGPLAPHERAALSAAAASGR